MVIVVKFALNGVGGKGLGETSRMKTVKEWKGGGAVEGKRVSEREDSVVEKRWVRCSNTAIWWMSLWMCGTSDLVASRIRANIGCPIGPSSGSVVLGTGAGDGGGGGAAAAISTGK